VAVVSGALLIGAVVTTAGCGGTAPSSAAVPPASAAVPAAPATTDAAAASPAAGAPAPAANAPDPNAPEVNAAGDIPDNQVFVPFTPPEGGFAVSVPEG
jgi:hypothetical protein